MSKSLGNLVFVGDLLTEHEPDVVRLAIIGQHYHSSWEWTDDLLDAAARRLALWRRSSLSEAAVVAGGRDGSAALEQTRACLDDDLDVPGALAAIDAAASRGEEIASAALLLGVELAPDRAVVDQH